MGWRRLLGVTAAAALTSIGLLALSPAPAHAATFTPSPDPTVDGAAGSLRAAVAAATNAGGDEIDLVSGGTYTLTDCQGQFSGLGQLSHGSTSLTIRTPSGAPATIRQTCVGERVLAQGAAPLTLDNVIITGGNLQPVIGSTGGGIDSQGGVTLTNATVTGNNIQGIFTQGGAIHAGGVLVENHSAVNGNSSNGNVGSGGGISTLGSVTVTDSTVNSNTANGFVAAQGGGIDAFNGVTLTRSTVSSNTAVSDGNSIAGAFDSGIGSAVVTDSTLSGNTAHVLMADNGTSHAQGGVFRADRAATVTNSTLDHNSAIAPDLARGGAIFAFGLGPQTGVTLTNSTVTDNTASELGGGVWTDFSLTTVYSTVVSNSSPSGANVNLNGSGTLTSFGTVIALPQGAGANCASLLGTTTNGFNLSDDMSCGFTGGTDNETGADPMLAGLADNGGPTQTRLPQTGSPLIDAIPNASCQFDGAAGITTDQRHFPRPGPQNPACDIGAVEVQPPPPPTPPTPSAAPTSVLFTARFTG